MCWPKVEPLDLRKSGDGSKAFILTRQSIEAFSAQTGQDAGHILHASNVEWLRGPLIVQGSKVWLTHPRCMGWDFGGPGESPLPLPGGPPNRLRLDFVDRSVLNGTRPAWIQDTVTGNLIFRLPERYAKHSTNTKWDGRYLVVDCSSGEVVIMDFGHLYPQ